MGEEVSNKLIVVLALLVVIVVAVSTWLTVSNLNAIDSDEPKVVKVTERVLEGPPSGGQVSLTILPQPTEGAE
ncbi:MAG: hypothetical protein PHO02_05090 [Candidatus Nanoarchaeia archaeon]|nr:hypothetical protein [Candidatus Nanoarchaeia archaeon]